MLRCYAGHWINNPDHVTPKRCPICRRSIRKKAANKKKQTKMPDLWEGGKGNFFRYQKMLKPKHEVEHLIRLIETLSKKG